MTLSGPGWSAQAEVGADALVGFVPGVDTATRSAELGITPVRELLPRHRLWLVRDASGQRDGEQLAKQLRGAEGIASAEADYFFMRQRAAMPVPPNDPRYSGQWYLKRISVENAWATTTGSPGVTIQVIDNGCDMTHPDLVANLLPGLDVVDGDDDPSVTESGGSANHGTACAGIIGAVGNNGRDIVGVCPECKVRCVRFLDENVPVPVSADVDAMRFALDHPDVAVVSNSWGFVSSMPVPPALQLAIEEVSRHGHGDAGALVIFAAGNNNRELVPGELYSLPEVVTVGALNNFDEAAPYSNFGAEVDLTAPVGSLTLDLQGDAGASPGDTTSLFGGTSAACPVVAGVAGLLFSSRPGLTADEVRFALIATTRAAPYAQPDVTGHDPLYGYGIVDPAAALLRLNPPPDPPDPPKPPVELPATSSELGDVARSCGCSEAPINALLWLGFLIGTRRKRP